MNKLSERKAQLLIELVRANSGLYDKRHPNFKKTDWKDGIWTDISEKLNTDKKVVKIAWRSLRDQFIKSYKESQTKGKIKKYKNFERLSFLADTINGVENNPLKYEEMTVIETLEDCDTQESAPAFDFVPWSSTTHSEMVSEESTIESCTPVTMIAKNKQTPAAKETFSNLLENVSKEESQESLNIDLFFRSMASTVKSYKLSHREFARLQCEVTSYVIDRLNLIEENRLQ